MGESFDKDLCEEVRKNIYSCIEDAKKDISEMRSELRKEISDLRAEYKKELSDLKKKIAYFNVVGIGILVSIITGLITNLFRG